MSKILTKDEVVDAIIANEKSGWTEDERGFLLDLDDDKLDKVAANAKVDLEGDDKDETEDDDLANDTTDKRGNKKPGKGKVKDAVDKTDPTDGKGNTPKHMLAKGEKAKDQAPLDNESLRNLMSNMSADEFLDLAPEGVRDMLQTGMTTFNAEKDRVVASITANKANTFTKEFLQSKQLDELQALAKLAANATPARRPHFIGDPAAGMARNTMTQNVGDVPVLEMPKMEFGKKD
jgi:hypothetical protein